MAKRFKMHTRSWLCYCCLGSLLAACSKSENNGGAANGNGTAEANNKEDNAAEATKASARSPIELSMFVDATWYPFQDWSGEIPELITKATCVKPKVTVATDDKQLALMVASGDLPDLILPLTSNCMSDGNVSLPYNDIFPKYAPDVKFDPVKEFVNTVSDGNYYAIRNDFSTEAEWKANPYAHMMVPGLSLRKDILQELGNPAISSIYDLDKVFADVKEKHPDITPLIINPNWQRPYFDVQYGAREGSRMRTERSNLLPEAGRPA